MEIFTKYYIHRHTHIVVVMLVPTLRTFSPTKASAAVYKCFSKSSLPVIIMLCSTHTVDTKTIPTPETIVSSSSCTYS